MFTVETKVNGTLISHLICTNIGMVDTSQFANKDMCIYDFEYYKAGYDIIKDSVTHNRLDGIEELINKIMQRVRLHQLNKVKSK